MRSGRFVKQPSGYKAFIPEALPPTNPALEITPDIQIRLSRADRALGRLDGSIQTLPDPDLFVFMYIRKEAVLSSQIEGTQSSLSDVLEAEADLFGYAPLRKRQDVFEVINYINALNHGLNRLHEIPVSVRLTKEIHAKLLNGVRGSELEIGEFRRTQNWIGPQGCTLNEALFVPPPPADMLKAISDLEKFIHSNSDLPLLLKIGLIHAQFETIHPFLDGNGRVGRLLIIFLLCNEKVLLKPVLYLSHYFKQHRAQYYDLLQNIRTGGDWEEWLIFFLDGIFIVSEEATETARRIVQLREAHRKIIQYVFGRTAANGLRILEHLYSQPIIAVADIVELTAVSYQAANQLMERFVKAQILTEVTGGARNRKYRYNEYIELFN